MKNEKITFIGIDSWNRPIFRSIDFPRNFFGATDILFSFKADEAEVLARISAEDLTYFGNKFDCEPMGTAASGLVIIKTKVESSNAPDVHGAERQPKQKGKHNENRT